MSVATIDALVVPTGAIAVGTGAASARGADSDHARRGVGPYERAVIPATALKGALRITAERLERTLGEARVCGSPRAERMCPMARPDASYCLPCQIFGSPWRTGAIRLSDLVLTDAGRPAEPVVRTRVAIDPRTRARLPRRLFAREVVPAADRLALALEFEPPLSLAAAGLLVASLIELDAVGGSRSVGYGGLRVEAETITLSAVSGEPVPAAKALEEWVFS